MVNYKKKRYLTKQNNVLLKKNVSLKHCNLATFFLTFNIYIYIKWQIGLFLKFYILYRQMWNFLEYGITCSTTSSPLKILTIKLFYFIINQWLHTYLPLMGSPTPKRTRDLIRDIFRTILNRVKCTPSGSIYKRFYRKFSGSIY